MLKYYTSRPKRALGESLIGTLSDRGRSLVGAVGVDNNLKPAGSLQLT
jgi:hypothetical protein